MSYAPPAPVVQYAPAAPAQYAPPPTPKKGGKDQLDGVSRNNQFLSSLASSDNIRVKLNLKTRKTEVYIVKRTLSGMKLLCTIDPKLSGAALIAKIEEMCSGRAHAMLVTAFRDNEDLVRLFEEYHNIKARAYFTSDGYQICEEDCIYELFRSEITSSKAIIQVNVEVAVSYTPKVYKFEGRLEKNGMFRLPGWGIRNFTFEGTPILATTGVREDDEIHGILKWRSEEIFLKGRLKSVFPKKVERYQGSFSNRGSFLARAGEIAWRLIL